MNSSSYFFAKNNAILFLSQIVESAADHAVLKWGVMDQDLATDVSPMA
jgi:hypothetical protein